MIFIKKLTALILSAFICAVLTACNEKSAEGNKNTKLTDMTFNEIQSMEKDGISTEDFNSFKSQISPDNIQYPYSALFELDEAIEKRNSYNTDIERHSYDFFGQDISIDEKKLYNAVKRNNDDFLKNDSARHFYEGFSDKDLAKYCKIISDTVKWGIKNNASLDISKLSCLLGNLKVLGESSVSFGTFNGQNGILSLSPSMCKTMSIKESDAVELTIIHESMHIMQTSCVDVPVSEGDLIIGVSCCFKSLPVNSLMLSWLYEGSAELNASRLRKIPPEAYPYCINCIESINCATFLNDSTYAGHLERVCFQKNVDALYSELGFNDAEKAAEFLYSAEIMINKPDDFFNSYKAQYGEIEDLKRFTNETYKSIVFETISKMFYTNLAKKLTTTPMSLNDIFYLISMHELDVNNNLWLHSDKNREIYKSYTDNYIAVQDDFFNILKKSFSVNINEAFDRYNMNYEDGGIYANASLTWLENEKLNYIKSRNLDLYKKNKQSIRKMLLNR